MIIVKIFQGLGNQLFQYALARSLEERHGVKVKLDVTWYKYYSSHRSFGLDRFNTVYNIASNDEIYNIRNGIYDNRFLNFLFRQNLKHKPYYKQPYFLENLWHLDPNILKINSRTYIEGYFTSELFFTRIRPLLLKELSLKNAPNLANQSCLEKLRSEESVCLSVRRGDFVKNKLHDVCNISYFKRAISYIGDHVKKPVFYIFSDDNLWVKENIQIENYEHHFVDHNFPDYFEDFRLMQNCKHHIIPNSTFSWWAAWLCTYQDKIVLAPKEWLNTTEIDYSYFLPNEWIKIENN